MKTNHGSTALHFAVQNYQRELAQFFAAGR